MAEADTMFKTKLFRGSWLCIICLPQVPSVLGQLPRFSVFVPTFYWPDVYYFPYVLFFPSFYLSFSSNSELC